MFSAPRGPEISVHISEAQVICIIDQARGQDGWILAEFFAGTKREIQDRQDRPILAARVANQKTGYASSYPHAESAI